MDTSVLSRQGSLAITPRNPNQLADLKLTIFSLVWGMATLFHMANKRTFEDQLHLVVLSLVALFLIYKPSSTFRLLLLIATQLFEASKTMPSINNHWIFTTMVNLTILYVLVFNCIKRKSFTVNRSEFFELFAPIVRIELLILYFYVVFHKLNSGFFFPEVSCASELYLTQNTGNLLPQTELFIALNAYLTIFIEALIPILLIFRSTRNWGILIGLLFHNVLAYNSFNGFYDFSSMIFASYFLFTDQSFSTKALKIFYMVKERIVRIKEQLQDFSFKNLIIIAILFICSFIILFTLTKRFEEDFYRYVIWTIYSATFIFIFVSSLFPLKRPAGTKGYFRLTHWSFAIFPLLVFVNGASPYLGLKTENSFSMFSNLRTEGGVSNHLIIPASSQIFDFQDDLVEITSSSHPILQEYANHNKLLVVYEFKHLVSQLRPESVEYIRNGEAQSFTLATASLDNELLQENAFFFRKFFKFRPVSKLEPQPCAH